SCPHRRPRRPLPSLCFLTPPGFAICHLPWLRSSFKAVETSSGVDFGEVVEQWDDELSGDMAGGGGWGVRVVASFGPSGTTWKSSLPGLLTAPGNNHSVRHSDFSPHSSFVIHVLTDVHVVP